MLRQQFRDAQSASGQNLPRREIQNQLFTITSCMRDLENQFPDFIQKVQKWVKIRRETTQALLQTAQELSRDGAATSSGTQSIEESLSSMNIQEATEMLQEDEGLLRDIATWIKQSVIMDEALECAFQIGFTPDIKEVKKNVAIFTIIHSYVDERKDVPDVIHDLLEAGYNFSNCEHFPKYILPIILERLNEIFNDRVLFLSFRPIMEEAQVLSKIKSESHYLFAAQSCINAVSFIKSTLSPMCQVTYMSVVDKMLLNPIHKIMQKSAIVANRFVSPISTGDELLNSTPSLYSENPQHIRENMINELLAFVDKHDKHLEINSQPCFQVAVSPNLHSVESDISNDEQPRFLKFPASAEERDLCQQDMIFAQFRAIVRQSQLNVMKNGF